MHRGDNAWLSRASNFLGEVRPWWLGRDAAELFSICFEALRRFKLRTSLSVLGVVLGVGGVIAVMSVSQGARDEILSQMELLGLENIVVRDTLQPGTERLSLRDLDALQRLIPGVGRSSALVERHSSVMGPRATRPSRVVGVAPEFAEILRLSPSNGRFLTALDEANLSRVCVLGSALAGELFGFGAAVGERIRIDGEWHQVVGILNERSTASASVTPLARRDLNQAVLVPLSAMVVRPPGADRSTRILEIWLHLSSSDRVVPIGGIVDQAIRRLHGSRADFEVIVPRALLEQRFRTQRTFSVVVGSMATLTLLVGGIGIMNIMLASVLERTHEIGLRRAVGATRRDITAQFLLETLLMTLSGGLAGVVLGVVLSLSIALYAGWAVRVSFLSVGVALVISFATGIAFGLYPAAQASRLAPIDALRYE